jgi:hypothetical protein
VSARPNRRRFLTTVGTAAAVPLAEAAASPASPPPPRDEIAALMDVVRQRFGRHLDDAQLKEVQDEIARNLRLAEALRRFRLDPAEAPATVFLADGED